jgi:hypothetical protein
MKSVYFSYAALDVGTKTKIRSPEIMILQQIVT